MAAGVNGTARFNDLALRLTRPGPRWSVSSVRIGLALFVLDVPLTLLAFELLSSLGRPPDFAGDQRHLPDFFGSVVFAPLVETALLVLVHRLVRPRLGLTGFVAVTALLAAASHAPVRHWLPLAVTANFAVMAYQYASFRDVLGPPRAFWGVALTHAVINGCAVLLVTAAGRQG